MQAVNNDRPYDDRQKLQREALSVATECGWRTIEAKGDQLIIRR